MGDFEQYLPHPLPASDDLDVSAFANMLSLQRMTNSYKIYWFYALFEGICSGKSRFTFFELVVGMIARSWFPIVEYKLNLGKQDKIDGMVRYIEKNITQSISKDITVSDFSKIILEHQSKTLKNKIEYFYRYVPYLLLTPFYPRLKGVSDHDKRIIIETISQQSSIGIYRIEDDTISVNEKWREYIMNNQMIIRGFIEHKLLIYLQKRNPNVPAIIFKISATKKRELQGATRFWNKIIEIRKTIPEIYAG